MDMNIKLKLDTFEIEEYLNEIGDLYNYTYSLFIGKNVSEYNLLNLSDYFDGENVINNINIFKIPLNTVITGKKNLVNCNEIEYKPNKKMYDLKKIKSLDSLIIDRNSTINLDKFKSEIKVFYQLVEVEYSWYLPCNYDGCTCSESYSEIVPYYYFIDKTDSIPDEISDWKMLSIK